MKVGTHSIVQALIIICGALVDTYDLVPVKMQKYVLMVCVGISAVLGIIHQFYNPDGTPAAAPWLKKLDDIKKKAGILPLLVLAALIPCGQANAQGGQGFSLGMAYNQAGTPQLMGWTTYDRDLTATGDMVSYSGYDLLPMEVAGQTMPKLKFTPFTGLAYRFIKACKLKVYSFVAGGISTNGDATGGAVKYGGFFHFYLGKGWGAIGGAEGTYSPVGENDFILRSGIRYGITN